MKKYFLGIFGLLSCIFCISVASAAQNGWGGNYSKDKACRLPDGLYERNIQITNYPWYNTFVKNFVKEKNILYYVISASPISDDINNWIRLYPENYLWSWNCKTKKSKQLSQEIMSVYSYQNSLPYKNTITTTPGWVELPQIKENISDWLPQLVANGNLTAQIKDNTMTIDYMDNNFIIIRYLLVYNTCVRYDFRIDSNSTINEKGCAEYRDISQFKHVLLNRVTMRQSDIGFDPNEENYSEGISLLSWYKPFVTWLREKFGIINCTVNEIQNGGPFKKALWKQFKFSEYPSVPPDSKCSYSILKPYIVDIKPKWNLATFSIKYGDGILWQLWYMDTIKIDLLSRTILQ